MSFIDTLKNNIKKAEKKAHSLIELVDAEEQQRRYSICENCPHLTKHTFQCEHCGCFMKVKTKLTSAKCPIGKW